MKSNVDGLKAIFDYVKTLDESKNFFHLYASLSFKELLYANAELSALNQQTTLNDLP